MPRQPTLWLVLLLGLQCWLVQQGWAAPERPNVILFLVDDMGWMDSTPYGSEYYDTPNMARLARESMRFTDAYALPLCSPTRASILTGQYSARHGITSATGHLAPQPPGHNFLAETAPPNRPVILPESRNFLDPAHLTLAEILRDSGYRTAHVGKWHLGLTRPHWPEQHGFETAFHCHPDPGPPGNYFSPYGVQLDGEPRGRAKVGTITDGPAGEYITDRLTDEALRFIDSAALSGAGRPFFLNLWHYGVHGPWGHKQALTAKYAGKADPRGRQGNPIMASMLKSVDESLGRILDRLDALKLGERTVLIFASDNGGNTHSMTEEDARTSRRPANDSMLADWRRWAGNRPPTNNAPLRDGKGRLYEGGIRVPLMVRWPGKVRAGATSAAVVGPIDYYPTILELAGIPTPTGQKLDGASFASVLAGRRESVRDTYFTWFPHLVPGVAVRQGHWKLIRRFEPRPEYPGGLELFNLRDDLSETTNLADKNPAKAAELNRLIDGFIRDTGALAPRPNPAYRAQAGAPAAGEVLAGLVPRGCTAVVTQDGALRVTAQGPQPFLGTAQVRAPGPLLLRLRLRSAAGGSGRVTWRGSEQADFPEDQAIPYKTSPSTDWQDVEIPLPIRGRPAIIRLYVPGGAGGVEFQSIEYFTAGDRKLAKRWDFRGSGQGGGS